MSPAPNVESVRYLRINPIRELLRAGQIVGLRPREMTLIALDQLAQDARDDRPEPTP